MIDFGTHAVNRFALAVFIASRLRISAICSLETPPARVIRGCVLVSHVPGSPSSCYLSLSGTSGLLTSVRQVLPATLMGFSFPSQLCSALRVSASFNASRPPAVSPCAWPRVSSSRDLRQVLAQNIKRLAAASGFCPRETAVPCYLPAPPWLLCIGPIEFTCRCCPGIFSSLRFLPSVSGHHFWGHFRPGFSSGAMDVSASDPVTSTSQACPSALSGADG